MCRPGGGRRRGAFRRARRSRCGGVLACRVRNGFDADGLAAELGDVTGQAFQHAFGLADHVLITGRESLDQVLRQGELR